MKRGFFVCFILFLIYVVYSNWQINVTTYEIYSDEIPTSFKGFKIAQVSDLHNRDFGEGFTRLIKKIHAQNPDIVVLTGDMVSATDTDFTPFYHFITEITNYYPIYYIVGNHEQALEEQKLKELKQFLTANGVIILDNEFVTLEDGEDKIYLYGMWYHLMYYKNAKDNSIHFGTEQMNKILSTKKDGFSIGLIHNPVYFHTYADWGMDLVLSGHMHGGIINVPFKGGLLSPEIEFFPTFDAGYFKYKDSQMIISRGLGDSIPIPRLFNTPELVMIELK